MSARIRGEHDTDWAHWRPRASREGATATVRSVAAPDRRTRLEGASRWGRWRTSHRLVLGAPGILAVAIAAGSVAVSGFLSPAPAQRRSPPTPRASLDAYESAAIDNPSLVCSELFSPQLARAYGTAVHGSCTTYFSRITSFSVIVRRVLQDGDTAVLELRQTVRPRDWAVVLSRQPTGWRAVDLLAGDLVR
jgi:hypothetical protein